MFAWLRRFTHPLGQIDLAPAVGRLRPVRLRVYANTDFERCVELYRLNEPDRFPPGVLPEFERTLRERSHLYLVIEDEGVVVGCGGIGIYRGPFGERASLIFGLIHPHWQLRGFGIALLLARLASLPEQDLWVTLQVVLAAQSFYKQFGFVHYDRCLGETGEPCDHFRAYLKRADREERRARLMEADIELPWGDLVVPVHGATG